MKAVLKPHLVDAKVQVRAADVVLTYVTSGDQPMRDLVTFSTTFLGTAGEFVRQLGFKLENNRLAAAFSFDQAALFQYNYRVTVDRVADRWMIVFPRDALGEVECGRWQAELDIAGLDGGKITGAF
jgi:hypothetical protein